MCRFFIYKGEVLKLNYLFEFNNSILKQSMHVPFTPFIDEKNCRDHGINGDGFGICWEKDKKLYFYKSSNPPWNDVNISNLSDYIESKIYLCHIRAIKAFSTGSCVHEHNCHPFIYKNLSWMHNGNINNKTLLCKYLYQNCDIDLLKNIKGNTDSEYCFYIFINLLKQKKSSTKWYDSNENILIETMEEFIKLVINLTSDTVSLNFCIYDGRTLLCTRFINSEIENPPSLYYSENFKDIGTIISSEPITKKESDWILVPKNHLLLLNSNDEITMKKVIL